MYIYNTDISPWFQYTGDVVLTRKSYYIGYESILILFKLNLISNVIFCYFDTPVYMYSVEEKKYN